MWRFGPVGLARGRTGEDPLQVSNLCPFRRLRSLSPCGGREGTFFTSLQLLVSIGFRLVRVAWPGSPAEDRGLKCHPVRVTLPVTRVSALSAFSVRAQTVDASGKWV